MADASGKRFFLRPMQDGKFDAQLGDLQISHGSISADIQDAVILFCRPQQRFSCEGYAGNQGRIVRLRRLPFRIRLRGVQLLYELCVGRLDLAPVPLVVGVADQRVQNQTNSRKQAEDWKSENPPSFFVDWASSFSPINSRLISAYSRV